MGNDHFGHGEKPMMGNHHLGYGAKPMMGIESLRLESDRQLMVGEEDEGDGDGEEKGVGDSGGVDRRVGPGGGRRMVAPWVHGTASRWGKVPALSGNGGLDGEDASNGGLVDENVTTAAQRNQSSSTMQNVREASDEMRQVSMSKTMSEKMQSSWDEESSDEDEGFSFDESDDEVADSLLISDGLDRDIAKIENVIIASHQNRLQSVGEDDGNELVVPLRNLELNAETGVSWEEESSDGDEGCSSGELDDEDVAESGSDVVKLTGSKLFPWEKEGGSDRHLPWRKSNTDVAERSIPEDELRRLRKVSLRMKERMKVGPAGVTEALAERIREKWMVAEVVKLKFEGPPSLNMKRTHKALEMKTGGLVIWRSGSSLVLYRGMTYEFPCVQSYSQYTKIDSSCKNIPPSNSTVQTVEDRMDGLVRAKVSDDDSETSLPSEDSADSSDIDTWLDQLGPRFKDWSGRNPLPVDADLLPGVVADYTPPLRLLPYRTRSRVLDKEMTSLRRLARTLPPHFALGRNRQHQGLAKAMALLWEKSAIAKIAIKRGVPSTCNDIMAEEIKNLTGGILVSRNKEYIIFYRGNDFLIPSIKKLLMEKEDLAISKQDEEEAARLRASTLLVSKPIISKDTLVAGTLAETMEANTRWANTPSSVVREKMKIDLEFSKHVSVIRFLERKLTFAQVKVRKAEKVLAKVQEFLQPAERPSDLETVTDEERSLFRKIGLKMKAYLTLGIREIFAGTIQNMHLNWKHRELVKIFVKGRTFDQVKQIAVSLEAESGGLLISLDKTTKGYAIIMYRGKNYQRPQSMRPKTLLSRREALARSIELQRREALNHHISNLRERIQLLKVQLYQLKDKQSSNQRFSLQIDDALISDDKVEEEGEEAYLETYVSSDDDE